MKKQKMRNRARCTHCNDTIESKHVHDYVRCSCGTIAVDGGFDYQRLAFNVPSDLMIVLDDDSEKPLQFNEPPKSEVDGKVGVEQQPSIRSGSYYKYMGTKEFGIQDPHGYDLAWNLHIHVLCLTDTEKHGPVFLAETDAGWVLPIKHSIGEPVEWMEVDVWTWRQAISVNSRKIQQTPW